MGLIGPTPAAGRLAPLGRHASAGSAMAESLVSMLVLLPFFVVIPLLGKQAHLQYKANEALRYAVWERSVWPGGGGSGGGGALKDYTDNVKGDGQIRVEARGRILGHPSAGIRSASDIAENDVTLDPMLNNPFSGERLLASSDGGSPLQVSSNASAPPAAEIDAASDVQDRFNLTNGQFLTVNFSVEAIPAISDWGQLRLSGREGGANDGQTDGRNDLLVHAQGGALLTDTWISPNESTYRRRVSGGVWDAQVISTTERPLRDISRSSDAFQSPYVSGDWAFGEARYGLGPDIIPDTGDLPSRYVHSGAREDAD